jgi:hypothetical protein
MEYGGLTPFSTASVQVSGVEGGVGLRAFPSMAMDGHASLIFVVSPELR